MIFDSLFSMSVISSLSSWLFKIFLCIAVYKFAKERNDKNAVLMTILTVIFGLIPAIVYFIYRVHKEKESVLCQHCGSLVAKEYPICMYCKQPVGDSQKRELFSKDVKKYLFIAAIFFVVKLISGSIYWATSLKSLEKLFV